MTLVICVHCCDFVGSQRPIVWSCDLNALHATPAVADRPVDPRAGRAVEVGPAGSSASHCISQR